MELKKKLEELVNRNLVSEDHYLVDIVLKGTDENRKVIVLLDGDSGINIDSCAQVSRKMASELEIDDPFPGKYILEVSSTGIDNPLTLKRQYKSRIGRMLKLTTSDGNELLGKLLEADDEKIVIEQKTKVNKKLTTETNSVLFDNIQKSMVQVSFK